MNILILDTTTYSPTVAYYSCEKRLICRVTENERNADSVVMQMKKDFSELAIPLKDIQIVSLSNGPGSYTGLRVGSAIAKGICLAGDARLVEISTLDILASAAGKDYPEVTAMIPSNSRTLEFYYTEYSIENERMERKSGYLTDVLENINKRGKKIVIDKAEKVIFPEGTNVKYVDGNMKIEAQYALTLEMIRKENFTDISGSEPFYLKDFEPLKSKKNNLI